MYRPSKFIPVSNRDLTEVLVPTVQVKSLEQLVSMYMTTGNVSGLEAGSMDSFDFEDEDHIDMDCELPQNMGKIEAILHFRDIRDSRRSPLQAKGVESPVNGSNEPVNNEPAPAGNNNNPKGA